MTGLARRMVTVPGIIIVAVVLAVIGAVLVPVSFPAQDRGLAIQAPGSSVCRSKIGLRGLSWSYAAW